MAIGGRREVRVVARRTSQRRLLAVLLVHMTSVLQLLLRPVTPPVQYIVVTT